MSTDKPATLSRLQVDGRWFVDEVRRRVLLRGVNLGGDCKVPYPDGGTNYPSDFADHREVSFIGRPFPLDEADEHFSRLRHWGFNCLRLLTTWEAIEHRGPGEFDTDYLAYYAELCRAAGDYGFYVFIDFHQDVWSRMSGGDGAPCWLFEKIGIDYRKIAASGSAHVMQHLYDYSRGGRQEDHYPTMSWAQNYSRPANGIMWTLFFAGRDFAPAITIDGVNVQDYMQDHYLACQREVALRVRDLPNVLGFDTLNEPGKGWIEQAFSYRHVAESDEHPERLIPGLAWSPLDGLLVSHGIPRSIPNLGIDFAQRKVIAKGQRTINSAGVSIWLEGRPDPFQQAGAWRLNRDGSYEIAREDFFRRVGERKVDYVADYLGPFFARVAATIREINPNWMIFAELDPPSGFLGHAFPSAMPPNSVNAGHWYDGVTLASKTFNPNFTLDPMSGEIATQAEQIQERYRRQLARFAEVSKSIERGVPTLIGECGIPFDLNGAQAYRAFTAGDHSAGPWTAQIIALDLMYNAFDALLLHSTQWNYTASNRNDLAIGDGWNQEDLSVFSRDQQSDPADPNGGGRAMAGFVRPYARATQGTPLSVRFQRLSGDFDLVFKADPASQGATEIFVPRLQYPRGFTIETSAGQTELDFEKQLAKVVVSTPGEVRVAIRRKR